MCTDKTIESNSSVIKKDNNTWNKTIFKTRSATTKVRKIVVISQTDYYYVSREGENVIYD